MTEWTQTDRRIGVWSATSAATIGVLFFITGLIGVVARPPSSGLLHQVDPYLTVLEILMILSAVALVIMMAAVYAYAAPDRKSHGLTALTFIILFAVVTCSVHFASLTVGRRIDPRAPPLLSHQLTFEEWPTLAMSLDLIAWDFFLGLSLIFAAFVFSGEGRMRRVRVCLLVAGTLCLAGTLGPASGVLQIQFVGIAGYAFALTVACALLAILFQHGVSP